ncbi:unnamed protein product [Ostreobium quekettii]|uniref:6-phosphogluconolactonase n=1 Tax=Ostreobium quekettii TaxID=121088 RepID=A0A8S1JES5_9CHLO|nr:unnamed protein product [Ostreobium quekettii]
MHSLAGRLPPQTATPRPPRPLPKAAARASAPGASRSTADVAAHPAAPADHPSRQPPSPARSSKAQPFIHEIPKSRWPNGVPAVMGAHLMDSGAVAPLSTSKGAFMDVTRHPFLYPDGEFECGVMQYPSPALAAEGLAKMVLEASASAIAERGAFTLVLSGGSLVKSLSALVGGGAEFDKWHVVWVDERVVPHDSPDSNYGAAREAFLSKVPIPPAQIHAIAEGLGAAEAAVNYEGRLLGLDAGVLPRDDAGMPRFDMVLLGIGPDGHVASLFPNAPQTGATEGWVLAVTDSPKPPPERITLTMPAINAAREVLVVALGEGKAEAVQRVLEVQALPGALPAQMVRPAEGRLTWVLDSGSARDLSMTEWGNKKAFPRNEA